MVGFLSNDRGDFAFQVSLTADDSFVSDGTSEVVDIAPPGDDTSGFSFVLADSFGHPAMVTVKQERQIAGG